MDHHPGRLVDHRDVLVLIEDFERESFRLRLRGNRRRNLDLNPLATLEPPRGFGPLAVNLHPPLLDEVLDPGTAQVRQRRRQMVIQPLPRPEGGNLVTAPRVRYQIFDFTWALDRRMMSTIARS